jgi:hypothetical protein
MILIPVTISVRLSVPLFHSQLSLQAEGRIFNRHAILNTLPEALPPLAAQPVSRR